MRKTNSLFKTAFISESGAELKNNDYFAFIELDDYACYVLASGISDFGDTTAAQEAVEHLILSFEENPSMMTTTLNQYMRETNERLLNVNARQRLKASVLMIVTDYEKYRWITAGNVRLRMYRQGRFFKQSVDMSLAKDLIDQGKSDTPLDKHEERHNLYAYLGKTDNFRPYISGKEKLMDADILAIYTQGFWEHVDAQEIDEVFADASDEPAPSIDNLEELLLSRQPPDLKSYTIAAIFVNKSYRDPERERKRLRYIKITIIVLIVLIIIAIIMYLLNDRWNKKKAALEDKIGETVSYIQEGNFVRAQESCNDALKQAQELKDEGVEKRMRNYILLLDAIIIADEQYNAEHYNAAFDSYLTALNYAKNGDNLAVPYIEGKLSTSEEHISIADFIRLGNKYFDTGELGYAEQMYEKARDIASTVYNEQGRKTALEGLEKVYDKRAEQKKEATEKINQNRQAAMAAELKKGDDLLAKGDLKGAQDAYLNARNLSDNPQERQETSAGLDKVSKASLEKFHEEQGVNEEVKRQHDLAVQYRDKGNEAFAAKEYTNAQMYYKVAQEKFHSIAEVEEAKYMQEKFNLAEQKNAEEMKAQKDAETQENLARKAYAERNFALAKQYSQVAKDAFANLGRKDKVAELDLLIEQITADSIIAENSK